MYKFKELDKTLTLTIDSSVVRLSASTEKYSQLYTYGVSAAFRAYFISPKHRKFNPFLSASFGPTYLSQKKFGDRELGNNFAFQTTLGFGTEIMSNNNRGVNLSLQLVHYCNAGLSKVNRGITVLYVFSVGYMF